MARREVTAADLDATSDEMIETIAGFYDDPLGYVLFAFPWGEDGTDLVKHPGPDDWQLDILATLGREVRRRGVQEGLAAIQIAVASGHGIGKSALVAWIILWFGSTRIDPATVVTANTLGQLSGKTWKELAKWHRRSINGSWFTWTATRFYLKDRPETHRAEAVPWTKEKSEAFAGTHAEHVLVIFDEASGIADEIWTVTEGAMTTEGAIWIAFGNPTRNSGRFRDCFLRYRHRWLVKQVDSRTARMANRGQIQAWIDDYGEDSDFVRVRVKGEFPRSGTTQLIPVDLVDRAKAEWRRRVPVASIKRAIFEGGEGLRRINQGIDPDRLAAWLLTCDVARFGSDQSVIGLRVGRTFVVLATFRGLDTVQLAFRLIQWIDAIEPDATFIDGGGVGGGVVDNVKAAGYDVISVVGAMRAIDDAKHYNRRTEMWVAVRDWLRDGGAISDEDQELVDDLTGPEYGYAAKDKLQLETKEDMALRGLPSPDKGDALAMSFFMPVAPRSLAAAGRSSVADKLARIGGHSHGKTSWMSH